MDPCVHIKPSGKLKCFVKDFKDMELLEDIPETIRDLKINIGTSKEDWVLLKLDDVKWLYKQIKYNGNKYFLHELLDGSSVNLPVPQNPPRNPELEARIQRLKKEQEQREYENMTRNIDEGRYKTQEPTIAAQLKEINGQLIAVAQFVFSVVGSFVFGYKGLEYTYDISDPAPKIMSGVVCALIVAIADLYFLIKHITE